MNEGGTGYRYRAYLVADMDFTGALPVVRQFCIFSSNPYHEPGLGPNRAWSVLMVRESSSFDRAKEEILHDLRAAAEHFPLNRRILDLLDESLDQETHDLKYRLPQALNAYITALPVPDHPFFRYREYVLEVTGARRITLSRPYEDPFWSLDFAGVLTSVRATKEAIGFLRKRGEQLHGGLKLLEQSDEKLTWRYRIRTKPLEPQAAIA